MYICACVYSEFVQCGAHLHVSNPFVDHSNDSVVSLLVGSWACAYDELSLNRIPADP